MKIKFHKRVISLLLAVFIVITAIPLTVFASPSYDLDQLVGKFGAGDKDNHWIEYTNGVRLTAINADGGAVATNEDGSKVRSIDWVEDLLPARKPNVSSSDKNLLSNFSSNMAYFGNLCSDGHVEPICKQDYKQDKATLNMQQGNYRYKSPPAGMPQIIVDNGQSSIDAIRKYFIKDNVIQSYCAHVFNYDPPIVEGGRVDLSACPDDKAQKLYNRLQSGELRLAVEPIAFFYWLGTPYAATPTEIGLLAEMTDATLGPKKVNIKMMLGHLSHKNAPNAIFLSEPHEKLGYPNPRPTPTGWSNSAGRRIYYSNEQMIKDCIGIGIIWLEGGNTTPTVYHHIYNLKLNIPKGAKPLVVDGIEIPMNTANVLKMLRGKKVKDKDGKEIKPTVMLCSAMIAYCFDNGYISNETNKDMNVPLGEGNWIEPYTYTLDEKLNATCFYKDDKGVLRYHPSKDRKYIGKMESYNVPFLARSSEVTEALSPNNAYPDINTGNKEDIVWRQEDKSANYVGFTNDYAREAGVEFCSATYLITAEEAPTDVYYYTATYDIKLDEGESASDNVRIMLVFPNFSHCL